MKITILGDWQNTIRTLPAFTRVSGHDVTIWTDHTKDVDALADRLKDTEMLVLIHLPALAAGHTADPAAHRMPDITSGRTGAGHRSVIRSPVRYGPGNEPIPMAARCGLAAGRLDRPLDSPD